MRFRDPVCGMVVDQQDAAGTLDHGRTTYAFCTAACMHAFQRHPERFVGPFRSRRERQIDRPRNVTAGDTMTLTECPYCGGDARAVAMPSVIGRLSLGECEAIVRGEWRRRRGSEAPAARETDGLIRALLLAAVEPAEPGHRASVEAHLTAIARASSGQQLGATDAHYALYTLSASMWDVLSTSGLPLDRATSMMTSIDRLLTLAA